MVRSRPCCVQVIDGVIKLSYKSTRFVDAKVKVYIVRSNWSQSGLLCRSGRCVSVCERLALTCGTRGVYSSFVQRRCCCDMVSNEREPVGG